MLRRKIYRQLLEWKNSADRNSGNKKCLVIKGARQVGKTYTVRAFGRAEYESYIEINFLRQPELKNIFKDTLPGWRLSCNESHTSRLRAAERRCGGSETAIRYQRVMQ